MPKQKRKKLVVRTFAPRTGAGPCAKGQPAAQDRAKADRRGGGMTGQAGGMPREGPKPAVAGPSAKQRRHGERLVASQWLHTAQEHGRGRFARQLSHSLIASPPQIAP
jgi:hypothetical protein